MPHPSKELSFKADSHGPALLHKGQSQGSRPGREAVPCTSSPFRAEPPCLVWIRGNQEGQGGSMFVGSASKEAMQLGLRKLGEAWRPPGPREGSKEAKGLAYHTAG